MGKGRTSRVTIYLTALYIGDYSFINTNMALNYSRTQSCGFGSEEGWGTLTSFLQYSSELFVHLLCPLSIEIRCLCMASALDWWKGASEIVFGGH